MASFGHVAVGLLAGRALKPNTGIRSVGPMLVCAGLALLPDLDYLAVMLGVPDMGPCGHRGATHSLIPPIVMALVAAALAPRFGFPRWRTAIVLGLVVASHPLLDAMTADGRGVPLLWPLSFHRFEIPWRPIPNAPCGLAYVSLTGLRVCCIEFLQFLPVLGLALWPSKKAPGEPRKNKVVPPVHAGVTTPRAASITRQAI